jgi:hypothetical protein
MLTVNPRLPKDIEEIPFFVMLSGPIFLRKRHPISLGPLFGEAQLR